MQMMKRSKRWVLVALLCPTMFASGCMHGRHYYFFDDQNLQHYNDVATDLENPDVESHALDEVRFARRPLTLENLGEIEYWDLSLEYVVQACLANSKILRRISVVGATKSTSVAVPSIDSEGTQLLSGLDNRFPSVYDPALKETQVGFGGDGNTVGAIGVEAALSEFDAQLSASTFWERNSRPVNVNPGAATIFAPIFQQDLGAFRSQISKRTATGGVICCRV